MMDTNFFIVAHWELVMINVPSASELAPSMTFERLVCHQDVAFVICVKTQDVTQFCCSLDTTCTHGLSLCLL